MDENIFAVSNVFAIVSIVTILGLLCVCAPVDDLIKDIFEVPTAPITTDIPTIEAPEPQNMVPMSIDEPKEVVVTDAVLPLSRMDVFLYSRGEYAGKVGESGRDEEFVIKTLKKWEFTEHGETVDYCYDATATLYIQGDSPELYEYIILLEPPRLRSLLKVLDEINDGKHSIEVTIENDHIISIGDVIDESGNFVWSKEILEDPRELTPIEVAFLEYRHRVDVHHFGPEIEKETEWIWRYLDPETCSGRLDKYMEWEKVASYPCYEYDYVLTAHNEDEWSALEIAARNAFAYAKIRSDPENKLIIASGGDLSTCYDIPEKSDHPSPFSVFGRNDNELSCDKTLGVDRRLVFSIITVPQDGYVTIKEWEGNDTWVELMTLNLSDKKATFLKYTIGSYPWSIEVGYLDEYYNSFGQSWSPDLSELTLDYSDEEIVEYLNSLDN